MKVVIVEGPSANQRRKECLAYLRNHYIVNQQQKDIAKEGVNVESHLREGVDGGTS